MNATTPNPVSAAASAAVPGLPIAEQASALRHEALNRLRTIASRTSLKSFPVRWGFRNSMQQPPIAPFDNTQS